MLVFANLLQFYYNLPMSNHLDQFTSTLRLHGYSLTRPRRLVFELLQEQEPQSIAKLLERVGSRIDRVTLYRTLDLFSSLGIVHRVSDGWKHTFELSDTFSHHHHHIRCSICGDLKTLHQNDQLEALIDQVTLNHGYSAEQHQLEIQGICKHCSR